MLARDRIKVPVDEENSATLSSDHLQLAAAGGVRPSGVIGPVALANTFEAQLVRNENGRFAVRAPG